MRTLFSWAQDRDKGVWAESRLLSAGSGLPKSFLLSFSLVASQCTSLPARFQQIPTKVSDDGDDEEFHDELGSPGLVKSTYTVVLSDCNAKLGHGGKVDEVRHRRVKRQGGRMEAMAETDEL